MPQPEFFFVGHPRSGTGAVNAMLAAHPDLFMATKELHYFGSDLAYNQPERTLENYLAHFNKCGVNQTPGEASTWYLASETAAAEIARFHPTAKVIISLREPVSWLRSLHSHLIYSGNESVSSFEEALALEESRHTGLQMPPQCRPQIAVLYRSLVRYSEQVARFQKALGPEQVHVVLLDDLKSSPVDTMNGIFRFLEVEELSASLPKSKRSRNTNRVVYFNSIRNWVKRPHNQAVLKGLTKGIPLHRTALRFARRYNTKWVKRPPLSESVTAKLKHDVETEVIKLEELLGQSTGWR